MIPQTLLDTGTLVALLDSRDEYHGWAIEQVARLPSPFFTCEAVVTEAFHLLRTIPDAHIAIMDMLIAGVLRIDLQIAHKGTQIKALLRRYKSVPMSIADACIVVMSENVEDCVVFTLDSDFRIYRRHGRRVIPLLIPPSR